MERLFTLETWQVISDKDGEKSAEAEAILKIKVGGQKVTAVETGVGPVDALSNVLRKALGPFYPEVDDLELVDYLVHIENSQKGTAAEVKVIIEIQKGGESYLAKAVSANIIEASWQALVEGFTTLLTKEEEK